MTKQERNPYLAQCNMYRIWGRGEGEILRMLLHLHAKPFAPIAAAAYDLCTHLCLSRGCTAGGGGSTSSLLCSCLRTSKVFPKAFPSALRSRCERPCRRALKKDRSTLSSRRLRERTVVKPSASSHETIRVVISETPSCTICAVRPEQPNGRRAAWGPELER